MSTRALIVRKKGEVFQYGQSLKDGHTVARDLNAWVPLSQENRDFFFGKMFELPHSFEYNGKTVDCKGSGLRGAGPTKAETQWFCDLTADPSGWSYNNGETPVAGGHFADIESFEEFVDNLDFPEYIIIWSDSANEFLSLPIGFEGEDKKALSILNSL